MQATQTPTTIYRLDRADLLPGRQDERDALIRELHGQAHLATVVAGHYEDDTFVVTDWLIADAFDDAEDGYWYGGADGEVIGAAPAEHEAADQALRYMERRYPNAVTHELCPVCGRAPDSAFEVRHQGRIVGRCVSVTHDPAIVPGTPEAAYRDRARESGITGHV